MTSAASQSSDASSRRLQMLAALDIDVWTTRSTSEAADTVDMPSLTASPTAALSAALAVATPAMPPESAAPTSTPEPAKRSGAGPGAALALLEQSAKPGSEWETSSPSAPEATADSSSEAAQDVEPIVVVPLDLWCLSGSHGVLLAQHEGISPHAQRLLNDILQTATRAISNRLQTMVQADDAAKPSRVKLQALRFTWPPAQQAGTDMVGQDTARALRGFLNRQLKGAVEPVLLYVGGDLVEVLDTVDLSIPAARQVALAQPEALMSDSTAKRALWRTLSAL